ncbi:hypothetical protein [Aeromonas veronii]|uniref:hypothetical protein n=1 Tax=Aeromonas veronii TaxID=654 RepID=UPI000EB08C9C|nr:hypothetical protein [Aeromonas veronii]AYK20447.1 hypothetical protein C0073_022050 [Aeromonas veronii]AYK20523.1 hypothetical protein C0073_022760 [Aeromonas veronii]
MTAQLANFASDWGELATPVLSGTLRRAGTNEVEAIVQYRSADEAIDDILQSGHDAHLRAARSEKQAGPTALLTCVTATRDYPAPNWLPRWNHSSNRTRS